MSLIIVDVSILIEFVKFEVVSLYFMDGFDIAVCESFYIFDQFVFELKVDEAMAELCFGYDQL